MKGQGGAAGWLREDEYEQIVRRVPILCVDVLPRTADGYALIRREGPQGVRGLNLVGGRVMIDEPLPAAVARHVRETLGPHAEFSPASLVQVGIFEYFRREDEGRPWDPRKHAVSVTYTGVVRGDLAPTGEALGIEFFAGGDEPAPADVGFGQHGVILRCLESIRASAA